MTASPPAPPPGSGAPLHRPALAEWSEVEIAGVPGGRLMVVLRAPGCAYQRRTGGCTNCGFAQSLGTGYPVDRDDLCAQLERAAKEIPGTRRGPVRVDLYVSGSFFNPEEIPADAQGALVAQAAALPGVAMIRLETRPEHVDEAALARVQAAAGGVALEIAVGLESADDEILARRIRKGFRYADFERAAVRVTAAGAHLFAYVLLKPLATPESEAVEDSVRTIRRVAALAEQLRCPLRIGLEPCFVAAETALEKEWQAGRYRPPWLWSVVEVVRRVTPAVALEVGLSDEGLSSGRTAHNCGRCDASVRAALRGFNLSQDPAPLASLRCGCQAEWRPLLS